MHPSVPNTRTASQTTCFVRKQRTGGGKNKSKSKPPTAAPGGFGSSSKGDADSLQGKIRSVSGHRGSGEKPLRAAANTFDAIRKEHGKECCSDVYCRSPLNDPQVYWFVGKVAVRPDTVATATQAVLSQKRVILEYAKRELRPQNLGGNYATALELWLAPGDSEMDCVQNKITLEPVVGAASDLHEDFRVADVGYNPEIYVGDEIRDGGLRVLRDEEGKPIKPVFDVNESL